LTITLVFEKNANFFAENCRKSQKIGIITSTPGERCRLIHLKCFSNFVVRLFLQPFIFLNEARWQCILCFDNSTAMYKGLKTLHPGGIRARDLLFCRRMRWLLYHAAWAFYEIHSKSFCPTF
jgi:hypothetical protein